MQLFRLRRGHMVMMSAKKEWGTMETYFSSVLSRVRFVSSVFATEYS